MKHLLTIFALLLSTAGIATSLIREEVRCYLGLPSHSCPTSQENAPLSPKTISNPASLVKSTLDQSKSALREKTIPVLEPLLPKKEESSEVSEDIEPETAIKPQNSSENLTDIWSQPQANPQSSEPQGIPIPVEPYSPPENSADATVLPVEPTSP